MTTVPKVELFMLTDQETLKFFQFQKMMLNQNKLYQLEKLTWKEFLKLKKDLQTYQETNLTEKSEQTLEIFVQSVKKELLKTLVDATHVQTVVHNLSVDYRKNLGMTF